VPTLTTELILAEDQIINCLIPCHMSGQPCTLFFKYKSEGEINVYSSMTHTNPDENNFEKCKKGRPVLLRMVDKNYSKE